MRIEQDSLGTFAVPDDAWYGVQTARAVSNFTVSGRGPDPDFVEATVRIKLAAAAANRAAGWLDEGRFEAIAAACRRILAGELRDQFVVDRFQAGAGTSHNMNVNEVIANVANVAAGGERGRYDPVHPNDHVNLSQSTNDVIPAAIRLGGLWRLDELLTALKGLQSALEAKSREFDDIIKSGRTHLQDAVPVRMGQEFGAYAKAVEREAERIARSAEGMRRLGIGGTADLVRERTKHATNDGRHPEEPKLRQCPTAHVKRNPRTAGRIHRGIGDGNADEVNERQAETDGERSESRRSTLVRSAEDDEQKEHGHDDLADQRRHKAVAARRVLAESVRRKTAGKVETGFAAGDEKQNAARRNRAQHLSHDVRQQ